jgi:hypothetical protein
MSWNAIGYSLLLLELILLVSLPRAWVMIVSVMFAAAVVTGLMMLALLAIRMFTPVPFAAG